ncbi:aminotransferase [Gemmatimonadetes bacterium T265]|nr:aminotransferase [Gemmatimonadetes bacterium T265]
MTPDLLRAPPAVPNDPPHAAADRAARLAAAGGTGATDVLAAARALEAAGRRVVHLEVGEPDAPTPPHVVEAGVRALRDGHTRYGPTAGIPELRAAAAAALAARGVPAEPARVVVAPGAKALLFSALLAAVRAGDEVLVPDPGYGAYGAITEFAGGRAVRYRLDAARDFAVDPDEVASHATSRTRVLVLNAPHNPTGGVIDPPALAHLAELAQRHDLLVVSDEIYARHVYPDGYPDAARPIPTHPSIAGLPGMAERTVVVDGFSKAYAMTGWRLGYAALPPALVAPVTALLAQSATCTPAFVQHAGVAALAGPQDSVVVQVAELRRRRDWFAAALGRVDGVRCARPRGAFYVFPRVDGALAGTGHSAESLAAHLLAKYSVACVAGSAFGPGGAGHLRFAYTAPVDDLAVAVDALAACMAELRGRAGANGVTG